MTRETVKGFRRQKIRPPGIWYREASRPGALYCSRTPRGCQPVGDRSSFTLVESMVAIAMAAMAGAAVLAGIYAALSTGQQAVLQTIAQGIAEQWLDEILGSTYSEAGAAPYTLLLGPEGSERTTGTRALFDDLDDYHLYTCMPPVDRWGIPLGRDSGNRVYRPPALSVTWPPLGRFRVESTVTYVRKQDLGQPCAAGNISDYRAVEVQVFLQGPDGRLEPLSRLRRVVAFIPLL